VKKLTYQEQLYQPLFKTHGLQQTEDFPMGLIGWILEMEVEIDVIKVAHLIIHFCKI
jgi:hypothetical protein